MEITYQIADGYAGGSRPQYVHIDDEDLVGLSASEVDDFISEVVDEDFSQRCYWEIQTIEYKDEDYESVDEFISILDFPIEEDDEDEDDD